MKGEADTGSLHWQAILQEITPWKSEERFKLEEVVLFLSFIIKSLWFQLGKQRCLANMLLPAFGRQSHFQQPGCLSRTQVFVFTFKPSQTLLLLEQTPATLVEGKVHIRWIVKQNKVLLLSQSCYSVTPLTLFL